MGNANEDVIYHTESDVLLGEIHPTLFSLTKGKLVWNGDKHTVLVTSNRLVFLPEDKNGKLKSALATAAFTAAKFLAGVGPMPKHSTRAYLAGEGFDLFGERSISWRYFLVDRSDQDSSRLEGEILYNAVVRRSSDFDKVNDFTSLPSAMLAMKFANGQRALAFFEKIIKVRGEWEKR